MQVVLNGIVSGAAIALLATAFQATYLPTGVFFVGLAAIYSVAPYIASEVLGVSGSWPLAILASTAAAVGLSLLCEWANHARLTRRGASDGAHLISSLGIYIVLVQAVAMIWGNNPRTLHASVVSVTRWDGLVITGAQWTIFCVAAALLAGFSVFLAGSNLGSRLRALADNSVQFALYGYNLDAHRLVAFGLSGVFATAASLVTANEIGFEPHAGLHAVLLAVVAVILGGRRTFLGPSSRLSCWASSVPR